ncbi:hypothetical protein GCM10028787_10810 [Brachybacterium horti]
MDSQNIASRTLVDQVMARYGVGPMKAMKIIAKAEKHMTRQSAMSRGYAGTSKSDPTANTAWGNLLNNYVDRETTVDA